ncbi:albusnodin family lasso peptide [Streptomyces harbinensis]|uniref:albusnodin family lasso peptide n=1 Tax=Streptomyces harbinensis TaxID=1176198 RepID=UPI0034DEAF38
MDTKPTAVTEETSTVDGPQPEAVVLGDIVGLTLGQGAGSSEDKRRAYNVA